MARAYVNHGRWIVDCPREYCNNAKILEPRQTRFWCGDFQTGGCGMECSVQWPTNPDEIWAVLTRRPVPATRNWFPREHGLALRAGCPHGQSTADLLAENDTHGVK